MSNMLPYPGRNESYSSWDFRCKQWENDRARWNREQNSRSTNWGGYNYHSVIVGGEYRLPGGETVKPLKTFPSRSKLAAAQSYAAKQPGAVVVLQVALGNPNLITSREDYLVMRVADLPAMTPEMRVISPNKSENTRTFWTDIRRSEIYNNDNH